ncbi:hypothetical protein HF675_09120 [Serratia sp. JUb9]|uniref:hypothetical protein n=1 Tax=Serratia sp. JUb9 TaxID=2724469 RepID=UPI00164D74A5|nr:hypothetical protein [Serratia sp. JUb9]QNK34171.1 hypothetical protein HF675_09120 [Serratia sp. JUb9]
MRKSVAVAMGVILAAGMVLTAVLPYVKMEFASSAHYTEQDTREYEYYTPDLLKKIPKISKNYEFNYSNISGPQAFVFGIQFNGTTDTSKIRDYLTSEGYEPQKQCQTEAECWRSPHSKDVVSFYQSTELNLVSVEIYRSEYTE